MSMLSLDRLKKAFDQAVTTVLPLVDYHALYTFQVVSQNADDTLELQPSGKAATSKLPSMSNIQIRYGVPGVKATVQQNAQVLVGWQDGNPMSPYAALWLTGASGDLITLEFSASESIALNAPSVSIGNNAALAAARKTDAVQVELTEAALASFVFTAPSGGGPCVVTGASVPLDGEITAGSSEVTVG